MKPLTLAALLSALAAFAAPDRPLETCQKTHSYEVCIHTLR